MRKYQIVFSIVLLISIGSFGSSFAQEDYFEYKQYIDTIRLMLNSSSEELSLISNTPDSEFLKETPIPEEILEEVSLLPLDEMGEHLSILTKELEPWTQMTPEEIENYKLKESQRILNSIDFEQLSLTVPQLEKFHSILNEAIDLKNNNQFEESITKYKLALTTYELDLIQKTASVDLPTTEESLIIKDIEEKGGGCLIATATYGSELAPQVQFLREVRDNIVMSTTSGMSFMTGFNQFYYSFSPYIADIQRENPIFKETVKLAITPMISSLSILTLAEDGNNVEVLGFGISVIALNLGMYLAAPAIIIYNISKYANKWRLVKS